MSGMFHVEVKTRNVNSKRLLKEILAIAEQACNEYRLHFTPNDYEDVAAFFDMYLEDMLQRNVITQYTLVGDHRNNRYEDVAKGVVNLSIKLRQLHCINVTHVDIALSLRK